jgi:hypothetical protein
MTRRKRRTTLAPRIEACEPRALLSGGYTGINIGANSPASTEGMWVDVAKTFSAWYPSGSTTLPLTPQGYPLANAYAFSSVAGSPDGAYQLSFQGTGNLAVSGMGSLNGPVVRGADGVSRAQITVNHAASGTLYLSLTGVSASDPVHDLHLVQPGYAADTTQVFTSAFLARLQPFSTLRVMGLEEEIVSPEANWSDRTLPDSWVQTGNSGVAFEYLADLADASGKALWVNVPTQATDDFVTKLADLLRDDVTTGAPIYLEYSNEVWNTAFPAYQQVLAASASNPLVPAGAPALQKVADQSAFRLKQVAALFDQEFGARAAQVRPVLGGWTAYSPYTQYELTFLNQHYGNPSQYLDGVAIGDYVAIANPNQAGLNLNQVFNGMTAYMNGSLASGIKANASLASSNGLPLLCYEGGQSLVSSNAADQALFTQAQYDPRMGQVYRQLMAQWDSLSGAGLACNFEFMGADGPWGNWGLLTDMNQAGSPKWDAVMGYLRTPGDADLDGAVTFNDFTTLAAHYGQTGAWWQQGDFNHDNKVDQNDLFLLRAHIGPLTPAQAVQVALFDAPTSDPSGAALTFDPRGRANGLTYSWVVTSNGVTLAKGFGPAFTFTPAAGATDVVTLTVSGPGASPVTASVTVTGPPAA